MAEARQPHVPAGDATGDGRAGVDRPGPASCEPVAPALPRSRVRPARKVARRSRRVALREGLRRFIAAIEQGDEQVVEAEVLRWSREGRHLAPLALCVGAFVMLFHGMRRLWMNWRLVLVEALPAMWAWAMMLDLKVHLLGGSAFRLWQGPLAIVLVTGTAVVTVAAFYLNTVFAFALLAPEGAVLRPAFSQANGHLRVLSGVGAAVGVALGVSAFVVPRWGRGWFTFALGIAVGAQMVASVLVPARLVRRPSPTRPRRDRLVAGVIASVLGAVVCMPSYALGRVGVWLLGSHGLLVLGIVLLVIGLGLHSGATGAVKAIKMSAKAAIWRDGSGDAAPGGGDAARSDGPDASADRVAGRGAYACGAPPRPDEARPGLGAPEREDVPPAAPPPPARGSATPSAVRQRHLLAGTRWQSRREPVHDVSAVVAAGAAPST